MYRDVTHAFVLTSCVTPPLDVVFVTAHSAKGGVSAREAATIAAATAATATSATLSTRSGSHTYSSASTNCLSVGLEFASPIAKQTSSTA